MSARARAAVDVDPSAPAVARSALVTTSPLYATAIPGRGSEAASCDQRDRPSGNL